MWSFRTGDLIAKINPSTKENLLVGLVIDDNQETFLIKWIWFDKVFFMEKEGDIFKELNNSYLLNTVLNYLSFLRHQISKISPLFGVCLGCEFLYYRLYRESLFLS